RCHLSLLKMFARKINVKCQMILSVINDFELFVVEDEWFYSEVMCRRMKKYDLKKCKMEEKRAITEAANELNIKLELLREEAEIKHKEKEIEKEMELEKEKEKKEIVIVIERNLKRKEEREEESQQTDSPEVNEEIAKTTTDDDDDDDDNCFVECLNLAFSPLKQPGEKKKWMTPVKNALKENALKEKIRLNVAKIKPESGQELKTTPTIHTGESPPT
ncbi:MAG: hypothetical protein PHV66_01850, partial [Bacteroidales bacterium]|nr:hypothetical protein [Bacteroidales bacterium]